MTSPISWEEINGNIARTSRSTVDAAVAVIKEAILSGVLPAGSIIRQDEVAKRLAISKIPVREALRTLEGFRLVRSVANRGMVVSPATYAEMIEQYDLRRNLEAYALQRSIPNFSAVDFEEANFILQKETLAETTVERSRVNKEFHEKLSSRCGSEQCMYFLEILLSQCERYSRMIEDDHLNHLESHQEHLEILRACRTGDLPEALTLLDRHLVSAQQILTPILRAEAAGVS